MDNNILKLKLNLQKFCCVSFRLTTETEIEDKILNTFILSNQAISERHFSSFYDDYYRSKKLHTLVLRIVKQKENSQIYAIRLYYEILEPNQTPSLLRQSRTKITPYEIINAICTPKNKMFIRCDCTFSYNKNDKYISFSLPITIKDNDLFDEVRGIRFVKLQGENILWENFINLIDNNTMTHRVRFAKETECTLEMPMSLLTISSDISRKS